MPGSVSKQPTTESEVRILLETPRTMLLEMPIALWIAMADHPRQRHTEKHAKASHWIFAKNAEGAELEHLRHVIAARFAGKDYKVDGHTRTYLWEKGVLARPDSVQVTVHKVGSIDELNRLYEAIDAQTAAQTKIDQVYGGYRECGMVLQSKRLKEGFIVDALNLALRGKARSQQDKKHTMEIDLYQAVRVFKAELLLLDALNPQPVSFQTGVVAAALISLSLFPQEIAFYQRISDQEGEKRRGMMDPVETVLKEIELLKQQKRSWGPKQRELMGRTLRAFVAWRDREEEKNQYWFSNRIRTLDPAPIILEMKRQKGIVDAPRL